MKLGDWGFVRSALCVAAVLTLVLAAVFPLRELILTQARVEAAGPAAQAGPSIGAVSAVVLDGQTGRVLFDKQGNKRVAPASLTKIMTTLLAIERGRLDARVTVTVDSWALSQSTGSTVMGLMPGEEVTLEDLLYGMMLPSGNDAALAVAQYISGTQEAFVALMNQRAAELGLEDTHFANPHGLDAVGHYSSARDMAMLSRYAMSNAIFARVASTRSYTAQGKQRTYEMWNINRLLGQYSGADGVKIGYTDDAGQTIVGSAVRDGRRLFVSVMGSRDRIADSVALFSFYFSRDDWGRNSANSAVFPLPTTTPTGAPPSLPTVTPTSTPPSLPTGNAGDPTPPTPSTGELATQVPDPTATETAPASPEASPDDPGATESSATTGGNGEQGLSGLLSALHRAATSLLERVMSLL